MKQAIAEYLCQSGARVVVTDLLSNQARLRANTQPTHDCGRLYALKPKRA